MKHIHLARAILPLTQHDRRRAPVLYHLCRCGARRTLDNRVRGVQILALKVHQDWPAPAEGWMGGRLVRPFTSSDQMFAADTWVDFEYDGERVALFLNRQMVPPPWGHSWTARKVRTCALREARVNL